MKLISAQGHLKSVEMMTSVLRPGGDLSLEYPLVFDEGGPGALFALTEGEEVLSACAALERELIYPGGCARAGFIGSVATRADARGRGYATQLLGEVERLLIGHDCEYALLWADDPNFYLRRGYRLDGRETDYLVSEIPSTELDPSLNVRSFLSGDEDRLHELYTRHGARVGRSAQETASLLLCPEMKVLVATRGEQIEAYACFGRGADLAGVVHEWGGCPEGVLSCLDALLEQADSLFLMAPGAAGPMGELLDACGAIRAEGRLGMVKPLGAAGGLPEGAFVWGLDSI